MRWYILRALLQKEVWRHLADRGSLALAGLLIALALLLSFGKSNAAGGALVGDLNRVYVVFYDKDPAYPVIRAWVEHLERTTPDDLKRPLRFRLDSQMPHLPDGRLQFPENSGAFMIQSDGGGPDSFRYKVSLWYPGSESGVLAPWEAYFWKETGRHFHQTPAIAEERQRVIGSPDTRSQLATALVLIALFFASVYLLPSLTCEERERGVLLAQALSPASPLEILGAKFLFYPVLGMTLGAGLAGIYNVSVLWSPFFWLALLATALGTLGIGLSIASLARTQRQASMGALCYMLVISLFMFICQQNGIPFLPQLALEYHAPRLLHAALSDNVQLSDLVSLAGAFGLATGWASLSVFLFRRGGWQ